MCQSKINSYANGKFELNVKFHAQMVNFNIKIN